MPLTLNDSAFPSFLPSFLPSSHVSKGSDGPPAASFCSVKERKERRVCVGLYQGEDGVIYCCVDRLLWFVVVVFLLFFPRGVKRSSSSLFAKRDLFKTSCLKRV